MKRLRITAALLLTVMSLACMAACGGEDVSEIDYTGKYKVDYMKVTYNSMSAELNIGDNFLLAFILSGDSFVVTLNGDETFLLNVDFIAQASVSGTWEPNGEDGIALIVDGEKLIADCDGKSLSMDYTVEGVKMSVTLKK